MKEKLSHQHMYTCLGEVVSERRRYLRMSQKELAEKSGIDRVYLSNVENGRSNPTFGTVSSIAEGLRIKYSRLIMKCEECVAASA